MSAPAARWLSAVFGFGAGLSLDSLLRITAALSWPREASLLPAALLLGAAVGAALFFLFVEGREGAVDRIGPWAGGFWVLGGLAAAPWFVTGRASMSGAAAGAAVVSSLLAVAVLSWGEKSGRRVATGLFIAGAGAAVAAASVLPTFNPIARAHPVTALIAGLLFCALASLLQSSFRGRYGAALFAGALLAASAALLTHGRDRLAVGGSARLPADSRRVLRESWTGRDRFETAAGPKRGVLSVNRGMARTVFGDVPPFRSDVPIAPPGDGVLDVLALGLPGGDMVATLLKGGVWHEQTAVTVVESSRDLRDIMRASWPALDRAVASGALSLRGGEPRRFIEKGEGSYDVIIIDRLASPDSHAARALAFREDYLLTVESLRRAAGMLGPGGTMIVRGAGTGRTVLTLREAVAGTTGAELADTAIVVGRRNRPFSKLYFRPDGFGAEEIAWMRDALRKRPGEAFYYPRYQRYRYYELLAGENPKGLAFVTPQDLSPPTDDRPFFHHLERLWISPAAAPLPEEGGSYGSWGLQFIPPGDGILWRAALWCLLSAPALLGLALLVFAHRTGLTRHAAALLWPLFLSGAAAAAALRCIAALAVRFDSAEGALWAVGAFLAAAGAAWARAAGHVDSWRVAGRVLAVTALAAGAAGGLLAGGLAPHVAGLLWAAGFTGAAAGGFAGGLAAAAGTVLPRAEGLVAAPLLLGAAFAWPLAMLAAVSFGFSAVWLTAAAAAAGALYTARTL